jgi:hypothetical protein
VIALLIAAVFAAGAPAGAAHPDPGYAATTARPASARYAPPARAEDPDAAMLRDLELLEKLELLENLELFGGEKN